MPKPARVVVPSLPHHITHRGNRRSEILRNSDDCKIYLRLLQKHADRNGVLITAYCLMPNHVHLIAVPKQTVSLSNLIQETHGTFSQLLNCKYGLSGHTWEGRFFSCPLDPAHFWNAIKYVEDNPVRAGIVQKAEDYPWSSAPAHCGIRRDPLLSELIPPLVVTESWSAWLQGENAPDIDNYIRTQTFAGYPCGSSDYFQSWESRLGRRLLPRPKGRPPQNR